MHDVIGLVLLLPVIGLATWQICEIWNHGSIFDEWRQTCQTLTERWWARLLSCMFCLSNWVALLCGVAALLALKVNIWFGLPLCMFAGARLANLGNDVFKDVCLTPNADDGLILLSPSSEEVPAEAPFSGILPKPGFEEGSDFHA